jgi:DNA polymerase-3 subunit alpha
MAVFALEDLGASMEVMVFPKTMADHGHKLADDVIVLVKGRIDRRDDLSKIICHEIEVFRTSDLEEVRPVHVHLPIERVRPETVAELKGLLASHPGDSEVFLHLGDRQVLRLPPDYCVDPASGLVAEIRVLLGADAVLAG